MTEIVKDARVGAFFSREHPEVFHSVCHRQEIFREDPLDVAAIHAPARELFERLLHQATSNTGLHAGRILLLKGESGSGKTHLMRAFRTTLHTRGLGNFGYMQMTSTSSNYPQYMLSNLITSLDQPYTAGAASALMRLSNALVENEEALPPEMLEMLRSGEGHAGTPERLINLMADHVLKQKRFRELDVDVVRMLLFFQMGDPHIKGRALAWLRCEDLSEHDRSLLGGVVPRKREEDPPRMLEQLGKAMWVIQHASLVMCIDQLEDTLNADDPKVRFQRAMNAVCALADAIPSSVFVISCLEDYYTTQRDHLARSARDRIEHDPEPMVLNAQRSSADVAEIIETRLRHLYSQLDAPFNANDPLFPFTQDHVALWANMRIRDILDKCREFRDAAVVQGKLPVAEATAPGVAAVGARDTQAEQQVIRWEQRWNDFCAAWSGSQPTSPDSLAQLLARAAEAVGPELESGHRFDAKQKGTVLTVKTLGLQGESLEERVIGICNGKSQGGALGREVASLRELVGKKQRLVLVRSTEYPAAPKTKIAQLLGEVIAAGGVRVVVSESDWRAIEAMGAFQLKHGHEPHFQVWKAAENPLSRLEGIRAVFGLDALKPLHQSPAPSPPTRVVAAVKPVDAPKAQKAPSSELEVGTRRDLKAGPYLIARQSLAQHAAFLGGSGSGKTTLALQIIEQLLLARVPVIMVDRKGDLASYARPEAWLPPEPDAARAERRSSLAAQLDVKVWTPGNPSGAPLSIAVAPKGLAQLPQHEREAAVNQAAFALGSLVGHKGTKKDRSLGAILAKAIELLGSVEDEPSLESLLKLVAREDPSLVNAVGVLDKKLFAQLAVDLQTLLLTGGSLVNGQGPRLDAERLLGLGAHAVPGKTRLSVISTKFLGNSDNQLFFVAQLLIEMSRWTSKNPSPQLQAVIMLDEADLYLPATSKPPTKEPMENLLRRARSAGLSVMLASQSPADFDYKCRDTIRSWFVGRVKETNALNKMKPMLVGAGNLTARIPAQGAGEFVVLDDGKATELKAHRSLVLAQQIAEDELLALSRLK